MKTKNIAYCAIFTALIAVSAFIRIPVPPVPFTAQTVFVLLCGLICGAKHGSISTIVYLIIGLLGIPVFTTGGGLAALAEPTFGFILGFIPTAFVTGFIGKNATTFCQAFLAALVGNIVLYAVALAYVYILSNFILNSAIELSTLLISYCAIFIPSDIAKSVLAAYVYVKLKRVGAFAKSQI